MTGLGGPHTPPINSAPAVYKGKCGVLEGRERHRALLPVPGIGWGSQPGLEMQQGRFQPSFATVAVFPSSVFTQPFLPFSLL